MIKSIIKKDFFQKLQVFLMIFLSGSCVATNGVMPISLQMGLWALLVFSLMKKLKNKFAGASFHCALVLIFVVLLSDLINGERLTLMILMILMLFVSYLFVARFTFEKFASLYIDVMAFLSIISLIGFGACLFIPSLQSYNLIETSSRFVANFYLYVHAPLSFRNFGLFWEPGAFQAFLSIALLFEIYRSTPSIYKLILFVITSLSTLSTTGFISIGFILLLILLKNNRNLKKVRRAMLILLPLLIFVIIANASFLTEGAGSVFGKLIAFQENKDTMSDGSGTTASVRYFSVVKPIEEFMHSPIFGCGYENLQKKTEFYTGNMNTCTFVNFFAIYGLFFGFIMFLGYWRMCTFLERNKMFSLYLFVLFFLITMTENLLRCPSFLIIPLYGMANNKILLKKHIDIK